MNEALRDVTYRLFKFAFARDRAADDMVRGMWITDDEAMAILDALGEAPAPEREPKP